MWSKLRICVLEDFTRFWKGHKGKQAEQALKVFEGMVEQGVVSNAITYSVLISACEKGK